MLAAAPKIFVVALLGAAAVFVPRLGVLAAGARRWVHLGPISGSPSPLLAGAVALWLAAAESGPEQAVASTNPTRVIRRRAIAVAGSLLAVLVMALEPDFSAAATTLVVAFATVAAAGRVPARRLVPVAALLLALLAGGALRSAYVDNRIRGFVSPERDPRGKGFEVLALAHANAAAGAAPAGLGRGRSRHRLSSSASDYAFALVTEELGRTGALAVLTCWAAIGLGVLAAAHGAARRHDVGGRALAAGLGTALLVPAALHVAVCRGWLPIIGVTMPLLSYDPGLTVVSGAEIGAFGRDCRFINFGNALGKAGMTALTDLTLVVVSGKGGVGRTTVTAALATAAAAVGKRVLIATSSPADRVGALFGRPAVGAAVTSVAPGIDAVNITPEGAIHEYGLLTLRSELVTRALFENRAARAFLNAVPGLDAYALLGKAWWHTTEQLNGRRRYDLVLLDGPASGHAALMLRIPDAIVAAMPKGPLARDATAIQSLLRDPRRAAFLIVTLAEELPAREAIELATVARGELALPLGPLVVNAMPSEAATAPALEPLLDRVPVHSPDGDSWNPALMATLRLAAGARAQRRMADHIVAQLRERLSLTIVPLPRLPTPEVGPGDVKDLASRLGTAAAPG